MTLQKLCCNAVHSNHDVKVLRGLPQWQRLGRPMRVHYVARHGAACLQFLYVFSLLRITTLAIWCHQDQDERHSAEPRAENRRQEAWLNVHCLQHLCLCPAGHPDACSWRSAAQRFFKKKLQSCVSNREFFTFDCLIAWLIYWLTDWLMHWLLQLFLLPSKFSWLTDWLIHWLLQSFLVPSKFSRLIESRTCPGSGKSAQSFVSFTTPSSKNRQNGRTALYCTTLIETLPPFVLQRTSVHRSRFLRVRPSSGIGAERICHRQRLEG